MEKRSAVLFDRDIADLSIHKVMELRSRDVS
jgi:hypothetical protein